MAFTYEDTLGTIKNTYNSLMNVSLKKLSIQPNATVPAIAGNTSQVTNTEAVTYASTPTKTAKVSTPNIKTASSGNTSVLFNSNNSGLVDLNAEATNNLRQAENMRTASALMNVGSSVSNVFSALNYVQDVKGTKKQYEIQKKVIDTNVDKTETMMMDNLMDNMAQLDVVSAAKNVDISSSAVQGQKESAAMDMSLDIRDMKEQANLNKKALDLQYAMSVKQAKSQAKSSIASSALGLGLTAWGYFG